jgi:hypothetical protein
MFLKQKVLKRTAILIVVSAVVALICLVLFPVKDSPLSLASRFLNALLDGRIEQATEYLSSDAKIAVKDTCQGSSLAGCVQPLISVSWGKYEGSEHRYSEPLDESTWSTLIYTLWSNLKEGGSDFVPVVVTTKMENGRWVVTGWRGFTLAANSDASEIHLVRGTSRINEFPKK